MFIIFFIGSVAETNRAPFDLAEAESELVSGFMTEHAAVIFVFFFLAEYASIVLMCVLSVILFLGGYLSDIYMYIYNILDYLTLSFIPSSNIEYGNIILNNPLLEGLFYSINIGFKSSILIFVFI
jgi:NADH-ubiquinone oxidoreductase chain 1